MLTSIPVFDALKLINSTHEAPGRVLGMHRIEYAGKKMLAVRALLPDAKDVAVIDRANPKTRYPMEQLHPCGLYEALVWDRAARFKYQLAMTDHLGQEHLLNDVYAFWSEELTEFDRYLFNSARHYRLYEKLGAHVKTVDGVAGVHFAVWAPNAKRVSVVGPFNKWDGRRFQMTKRGSSGIWELFVPDLKPGDLYKYEIKTKGNRILLKADPFAYHAELRPATASRVFDLNGFAWQDRAWMDARATTDWYQQPVSIYEVHLPSWMRGENNRLLTCRDLAPKLAAYVRENGFTHVELMPVMEHPLDASWGYQVTGYFAPTSRLGTPDDFMYFVDYLHREGIGVIADWVPAHFPKDAHGLARFDGTALYEHEDPRLGEHPDWGTKIFNYGRYEVTNFLISSALFWLDKYHLDGLRVDAVASMLYLDYSRKPGQWVPNKHGGRENLEAIEFIKHLNSVAYQYYPGIMMIAEESTAWPGVSKPAYGGGLGYGFKWNMGWMNDTLAYMEKEPIHRKFHHANLTFSLLYAYTENFILPFSHDEVVHGKRSMINKMPGDRWQQFAGLRALFAYYFGHPGKKLMFMGSEFGMFDEWRETKSLDWHLLQYDWHHQLLLCVRDLNRLYREEPALHRFDHSGRGFEWINCNDYANSVFSFMRKGEREDDFLVFVVNFTPVPRHGYTIGVPQRVAYREIFNSDAACYHGSNLGNPGTLQPNSFGANGKPQSLTVTVPPLAGIVLKPQLG
ncbi:MAG TPA: 1,4-alpha-glucan branching protein GlgB [bacterium]|nr:1,4-alpha-glucan branching protein GlgB [bacterium]